MSRFVTLIVCCSFFVGCSKYADRGDSASSVESRAPEYPDETLHDEGAGAAPPFSYEEPYDVGRSPAAAQVPPPRKLNTVTTIRVFYGTDRKATGSSEPNEFFGGERGRLSVGFCDVSIPPNHKRGELEAPSIWRLEFSENPKRHVMLQSIEVVDGSTFLNNLRATVASSVKQVSDGVQVREIGGELFVFVHGYNVTFKDAARRTAQMAHDLEFPGAPVLFSWPSLGEATLSGYREDERTAEWCEEHIMDFLTVIAQQSGARRMHLIAHSMGNRVLTGALRRLAYTNRSGKLPKFNEVILTAPDVDAETFELAIAPRITNIANRFTVYASENDVALKASAVLHAAGSRLGQGGSSLTVFPQYSKIDMVDASNVDTSLFAINHSYYGDSPTVLNDISNVLVGAKAGSRGLRTLIPKAAWSVPERLSRIVRSWRKRAQH